MTSIQSVAILINPYAGRGDSIILAQWLQERLTENSIKASIFNQQWPTDFKLYSDVWILGGDGTINYFINHYPECTSALALFKTGTGNDFAWKLYGNKSNHEIFDHVLTSSIRNVDAAKCNQTLFLNSMGIGFDGEILRSMKAIRILGGHLGYLIAVLIKIFGFREKSLQICCKDEKWSESFLLAIFNNSSRAGGGFFITPTAEINDGALNMLLCKKLSVWQRLYYLPILKKGKHLHLPFVIHRLATSFTVVANSIVDIQLDGELHTGKTFDISVLPDQFRFRY